MHVFIQRKDLVEHQKIERKTKKSVLSIMNFYIPRQLGKYCFLTKLKSRKYRSQSQQYFLLKSSSDDNKELQIKCR